jgi:hypothetical protein
MFIIIIIIIIIILGLDVNMCWVLYTLNQVLCWPTANCPFPLHAPDITLKPVLLARSLYRFSSSMVLRISFYPHCWSLRYQTRIFKDIEKKTLKPWEIFVMILGSIACRKKS